MDRDINAAINILQKGLSCKVQIGGNLGSGFALSTVGQTGSDKLGEFDPLAPLEQSCGVTIGL